MKLQELLKDVAVKNSTAAQDIEIKEVRYDSRAVQPGDLFVAIRGYATDGHKYIAKAMEADCSADSNPATVYLVWDNMDDFDAGKEPSQILSKIN